jgi:CMP-N,N'-diacetyllegionaminic acid synthase
VLNNKRFLAIIPARGGSKRLPRKNILDLAGKPLISWTIEAARQSKYLDGIIVSTDDEEIAEVASSCGASVVIRPDDLASDTASSLDVVFHAIESQVINYDYILLLQPTSPLRSYNHINEAIELLFDKKADAVVSVCETEHSPLWANVLPENGNMDNFLVSDVKNKRSQDLPSFYTLNGALYLVDKNKLQSEKSFFLDKNTYAYLMSREDSIDIDTLLDFQIADLIMNKVNRG